MSTKQHTEEEISQMFSDMVFLNEHMDQEIRDLKRQFTEFKASVVAQISDELRTLHIRLAMLERGQLPEREYIHPSS